MRLWSLHPKYLDRQGLTALWREGLLAQAVLRGRTRGYRAHPQLERFRASRRPVALIATYLDAVWEEARRRGYHFDRRRIAGRPVPDRLATPRGQLRWEWGHLQRKLRQRSPGIYKRWLGVGFPEAHPMCRLVPGGPAGWERGIAAANRGAR
ncbi:MAG TPA: pyrimidine dimer DNA glycosylase/endonuclease V [Gemmatimonadales bacterium]|nr:pyrimidine dimer DNA glycosylase/endonuclease V [Gemmatimonadales bacterium]